MIQYGSKKPSLEIEKAGHAAANSIVMHKAALRHVRHDSPILRLGERIPGMQRLTDHRR